MVELLNFCFEFCPSIIGGIYQSESQGNLSMMVIIIQYSAVKIILVKVTSQVLLHLEQRIQGRTGVLMRSIPIS